MRVVEVEITPKGKPMFSFKGGGIGDPRIEFSAQVQMDLNPNKGEVWIYNPSPEHIKSAGFMFDIGRLEYGGKLVIKAGYGDAVQIFKGDIVRANTPRKGVDRILYIEGLSLLESTKNANINKTFPEGTPIKSILKYITDEMGNSDIEPKSKKVIESLLGDEKLEYSETFRGDATSVLKSLQEKVKDIVTFGINDEGLTALPLGEPNSNPPIIVSGKTGMIGSPTITDIGVNINTSLNSNIVYSSQLNVFSDTVLSTPPSKKNKSDDFRSYVVLRVSHRGGSTADSQFVTEAQAIRIEGIL